MTSQVIYENNLRTSAIHLKSSSVLETDAPIDNNGNGERFSPTDLLATSLASCMITIMAIVASKIGFSFGGAKASVTKTMSSAPRKVKSIQVDLSFPESDYSEKEQTILMKAARECPVALSLSSEIEQVVNFNFQG